MTQEVLGELLDQSSNVMPEQTPPQRTTMRTMPCQELLCLLGVLVHLEIPFTKVPSDNTGKMQNTTVPRKSKEGHKPT